MPVQTSLARSWLVPNFDFSPHDDRLAQFGPAPRVKFPFRPLFIGSGNAPYCTFEHADKFGPINSDSGIGDGPYGLYLLSDLLRPECPGENREASKRIAQYHRRHHSTEQNFEEGNPRS